jgi:EAL domain-containing protein (putative c-di-GMP-specific phosphodiesterase class I)
MPIHLRRALRLRPIVRDLRTAAGRSGRVLGTGAAIAAVAGTIFILDGIVRTEARRLLQTELAALAEQAVRNAEAPISSATQMLVEVVRSGPVDCLPGTVARLRERTRTAPGIVAFNVVDASGFLMCSSTSEPVRPARLLAELSPRAPSIALAPDPRTERRGLLVAATVANGLRLVAELDPDIPAIPAGPAFIGDRLSLSLGVAERGIWRRTGHAGDVSGVPVVARAQGKVYPVVAEAIADAGVLPAGFRRILLGLFAAGGLAIGAILLHGWVRRRGTPPPKAAGSPPASVRTTPAYRPMVEIETGEIVGVDVVLRTAEPSSGDPVVDVPLLDQALGEMASTLAAHPELKLSLPAIRSGRVLAEIAAALPRLMPTPGIGVRQIVLTVSSNAATGDVIDGLRATGVRLAIDLSSEGGLVSLASVPSDFIAFGPEVLAGSRGLAVLRTVAEMAREFDTGIVVRDVETPEEIERLRTIGITTATGPVFGPALSARAIAALLAAARPQPQARVA